jgi:Tfp pilus assembly protein PilF
MQMAVARACETDGNLDEAIKNYADVLKKDSSRAEAAHRIAILYDMKGQPEKSRGYYMDAIKKAPDCAELYCDFGYSCYLQRSWAEAERNFRKAIELNPDLARAHVNYGMLLARTGRATAALKEFSHAGLDESASRSNLALAHAQENRMMEAQEEYSRALAVNPNSKSAKTGLAAIQAQSLNNSVEESQVAAARATQAALPQAIPPQTSVAMQAPAPRVVRPEPQVAAVPQTIQPQAVQTQALQAVQAQVPVVAQVPTQPPVAQPQMPVVVQAQTPPPVVPEPRVVAEAPQLTAAAVPVAVVPVAVQELPKPEPAPEPQLAARLQTPPAEAPALVPPAEQAGPQSNELQQPAVVQMPPTGMSAPIATRVLHDNQPAPMVVKLPPVQEELQAPRVVKLPPVQQESPAIEPPRPLPPVEPETSLAGHAEVPPAVQTDPQSEVRPLPPPTERAEALAPPSHVPDDGAAPLPAVRPPVETALRGMDESSPAMRR